jgi:hypothetical protein
MVLLVNGWSTTDGGITLKNITYTEISPEHWLSNGIEHQKLIVE